MKMTRLAFTITFGLAAWLSAQPAGNPLGAVGGGWTVGASAGYAKLLLGSETGTFTRFLVRSSWDVLPWLDWSVTAGTVRLSMESGKPDVTDYSGKYRFVWGVGFKMTLKKEAEKKPGFWFTTRMLAYPSSGSFTEALDLGGHWEYAMTYRHTEWEGCIGGTLPFRSLRVYLACAGWGLNRTDHKEVFYVSPSGSRSPAPLSKADGSYWSGFWTGGVAGLELKLPEGYALTLETLYFNSENYEIMLGISQTGIPAW